LKFCQTDKYQQFAAKEVGNAAKFTNQNWPNQNLVRNFGKLTNPNNLLGKMLKMSPNSPTRAGQTRILFEMLPH